MKPKRYTFIVNNVRSWDEDENGKFEFHTEAEQSRKLAFEEGRRFEFDRLKESVMEVFTNPELTLPAPAKDIECLHCDGLGCEACDARTLTPDKEGHAHG